MLASDWKEPPPTAEPNRNNTNTDTWSQKAGRRAGHSCVMRFLRGFFLRRTPRPEGVHFWGRRARGGPGAPTAPVRAGERHDAPGLGPDQRRVEGPRPLGLQRNVFGRTAILAQTETAAYTDTAATTDTGTATDTHTDIKTDTPAGGNDYKS